MKKRHFTLLSFVLLVTFCFQSALAQDTTRRSSAYKVADWSNEQLYRIKKNFKTITTLDTLQQSEYEQVKTKIKGGVAEIQQNCEDPLQPFAIIKDKNPRKGLRLNASVGPYFPYCGSFGAKDNTFYMNPGGYFNIGADYFITKVFGLGGTFGYALAGVDKKRHQADMITLAQNGHGLSANQVGFFPYKGYESMYLVLGPVLSLPIGQKFYADLGFKGGLFRMDPGVVGAYSLKDGQTIRAAFGSDKVMYWGYYANIGLMYRLTDNWSIGPVANLSNTNSEYWTTGKDAIMRPFDRLFGAYTFGLGGSYKFDNKKIIPLAPPAKLACDKPVLEGEVGPFYIKDGVMTGKDGKSADVRATKFSWNGGGAVNGIESYTFRLFKKTPTGTQMVYELPNTTLTSIGWPANEPVPTTTTFYYYTVHANCSNKCDESMSEVAMKSFVVENLNETIDRVKNLIPPVTVEKETVIEACNVVATIEGLVKYKRSVVKYGKSTGDCEGCICPVDTLDKEGYRWVVIDRKEAAGKCADGFVSTMENLTQWPADKPIPTKKYTRYRYTVKRTTAGQTGISAQETKYDLMLDRKSGSVQLAPIVDKRKKR